MARRDWNPLLRRIRTSEKLADLPDDTARAFYLLLLAQVDSHGRLAASPRKLNAEVWPLLERTSDQTEAALQSLAAAGLVQLYTVGRERFLMLPDWEEKAGKIGRQDRRGKSECPDPPVPSRACPTPESVRSQSGVTPESVRTNSAPEESRADKIPPHPPVTGGESSDGSAGDRTDQRGQPPDDGLAALERAVRGADTDARPAYTARAGRRALEPFLASQDQAEVVETLAWVFGAYRPDNREGALDLRNCLLTGRGLANNYGLARRAFVEAKPRRVHDPPASVEPTPKPWDCPSCGRSPKAGAGQTVATTKCERHGRGQETRAVTCDGCGRDYEYQTGRPCLTCGLEARQACREDAAGGTT